jgi:hypothetical protein
MIVANIAAIWIVHIGIRTFPDQAVFLLRFTFFVAGIVILLVGIVELLSNWLLLSLWQLRYLYLRQAQSSLAKDEGLRYSRPIFECYLAYIRCCLCRSANRRIRFSKAAA